MFWEAFSSYFQLAAAFTLTYAAVEIFMKGFDDNILNIGNYKINPVLFNNPPVLGSPYIGYIEARNKNISSTGTSFDPFKIELKLIIYYHKMFFFSSFLACLMFLIFSGFEHFYLKDLKELELVLHQKFCGLLIIPFIAVWILFFRRRKVESIEKILEEFTKGEKNFVLGGQNFLSSIKLLFKCFLAGLILIFFLPKSATCFFSHEVQKVMVVFMIITVLIPFISQILQMKTAWKRYNDAIIIHQQNVKKAAKLDLEEVKKILPKDPGDN